MATAALVVVACLLTTSQAFAHQSGCHSHHSCPSDHHSYIWYESSGKGWDCARPGAREVGPADTTQISYEGLPYLCHAAGGTTAGGASTGFGGSTGAACGLERWTVKTLQDRPRLLGVQNTTIAYLVSRPAPASLPNTRLPFERHIFRVVAQVVLVRHEADSDLHVVIEDAAGHHMITEAPLPTCAPGATPVRRRQMGVARAAVRLCAKARISGVAFFDFQHGQTGVAPNAIELHPILAFRCFAP